MTSLTVPPSAPARVERLDTIVVGAGQAGLAVGQQLAERAVDFAILSDEARVGDNWRRRWDSLRLFTPAACSGLPGMPFPAPRGHLADKDEVADFLEGYAARFHLPVRASSRVASLAHDGERFTLQVDGGASRLEADNVVVATGAFQRPRLPAVAGRLSAAIHQLHSSAYRNPFELPAGPVLVVGAGNSGAQIALELARYRTVWLAGRNTGHLPRRLLGRDLFDWMWPVLGLDTVSSRLGRRIAADALLGGDPLIGIPELLLHEAGVIRVGRVEEERGGLPACGDTVLEPAVIVWCTGFEPDFYWMKVPVFTPGGLPRQVRGVAVDLPGLFFMGLRGQRRLRSSLIGGVGDDARFIAARVAARAAPTAVT
jgi:putative flavoprotein involved in K+ transport